jgi:hypothetical protein
LNIGLGNITKPTTTKRTNSIMNPTNRQQIPETNRRNISFSLSNLHNLQKLLSSSCLEHALATHISFVVQRIGNHVHYKNVLSSLSTG